MEVIFDLLYVAGLGKVSYGMLINVYILGGDCPPEAHSINTGSGLSHGTCFKISSPPPFPPGQSENKVGCVATQELE